PDRGAPGLGRRAPCRRCEWARRGGAASRRARCGAGGGAHRPRRGGGLARRRPHLPSRRAPRAGGEATGRRRAVWELLGGRVRAAVTASAPPGAGCDPGYACAKVKVGPDADAAVACVAAARAALPHVALRADANGCWDVATAVRVARRLQPFGLEWLEQPVAPADITGMACVRRRGGVAVAADEVVTGPEAVRALAAADAADAVVLKLVQVGGLARARATAQAAA